MSTKDGSEHVAPLLPLHDVHDGGVRRGRGRPRAVEKAPTRADLEHHAAVSEQQSRHVENDDVVRAVVEGEEPREVLRRTSEALAREAATLEFQRRQMELRGRDVGQIVSRRANILVELTRLQVRAREMDPEVLDLTSEPMQQLFRYFIETIRDVAVETLSDEHANVFFTRLESRLDGWEKEAEARIR